MVVAREASSQLMESARISLTSDEVSYGKIRALLEKTKHLRPDERRLIVAEFATRHWMHSLEALRPLYPGFERVLWQDFAGESNLDSQVVPLIDADRASADAKARYYSHVRGMFKESGKSREEFYSELFADSRIEPRLGSIAFGERAMIFKEQVSGSAHREHLLVWYSARLLIIAKKTAHPTSSFTTEEELESIYSHFEKAIPLEFKFGSYAKSDAYFVSEAKLMLLPAVQCL